MSGGQVIRLPTSPAGGPSGGTFPPNQAPPQPGHSFDRGDQVELAEQLIADQRQLGEVTYDEGRFWIYDEVRGIWSPRSDAELRDHLAGYAGAPVLCPRPRQLSLSNQAIKGALEVAKMALQADRSRPLFETAVNGVAFRDKFVMVRGGVIQAVPHASENMARHAFDFDFDPSAPHPKLDAFHAGVFADADPEDAAERVSVLAELAGISLIGEATKFQQCGILHGFGANGKSSEIEIIRATFPPGSTSAFAPQDFGARFRTAGLAGMLANLVNEIPETEIVASPLFKSVISGEPITAERKMETPFVFRPRAGHIFCANRLPATSDHSSGFWRRFVVIPFTRDMTKAAEFKRDVAREIVEGELPGIIAWALEGAARVQRQGRFSPCRASDAALREWRHDVDPVARFVAEQCVGDDAAWMSSMSLFNAYENWASAQRHRPISAVRFWKRIQECGIARARRSHANGYRIRLRSPSGT